MNTIRSVSIIFGVAGLGLIFWLLHKEGTSTIGAVFSLVGINIIWMALYRVVPIVIDGAGWRLLFSIGARPGLMLLSMARWLGESVNTLLPVGQVGGHFVRARVVAERYTGKDDASATVTVDFTIGLWTQIIFTIIGMWLLVSNTGQYRDIASMIYGVSVAILAVGGFVLVQKGGLFSFGAKGLGLFLGAGRTDGMGNRALELDKKIRQLYARRSVCLYTGFWRLIGWMAKSGENWIFFYFAGVEVNLQTVLILESLSGALRSAAFFVPGGLGVQDGGLVVIGSLLGLDSASVMALAVAKRFRELLVGVPGILWWIRLEGTRR
jgi:putative membrane protein